MTVGSKIFMGIDVSKNTLDISVEGKHSKIANTKSAINNFIKTQLMDIMVELCVLESTGGYERIAIITLNEAGIKVCRAHPNKVHAFAKAAGYFAKTDRLDARLLEKYGEFINNGKSTCIVVNQELVTLQDLRSVERDLEELLHAAQCREKMFTGKAKTYTKKQIEFIKKQLVDIRKDIEEVISNDELMKQKQQILTSYKGVGKKIANSLIAELPELGKLNHKEIASLVGVAPRTNESGKKVGKGHIGGGRFYVRKVLYMAALVAAFSNENMKKKYRELLEKGKVAKVALTAIMRKIIVCLNAMVKNNKLYESL